MKEDQQINATTLDDSFFYKRKNDVLEGVSGFFVDDGLHAGNTDFCKTM